MKALVRAWLALTPSEQKAVAVVLALALLGAAVRGWHRSARSGRGPFGAAPAAAEPAR